MMGTPLTFWYRLSLRLATLLALSLCYAPARLWPLALVGLIPLSYLALRQEGWRAALADYLLGVVYFLLNLHWLGPVTWGGYVALCFYIGLYFPLYTRLLRLGMHRWKLPATLLIPLLWTAGDYLRATFLTGFPWFMLGNSLVESSILSQAADLFGVWGLTFLAGLVNGLGLDTLLAYQAGLRGRGLWGKRQWALAGGLLLLWPAYGFWRLGEPALVPGPTLAVIQDDIPQSVKDTRDPEAQKQLFNRHMALTRQACRQRLDLIAWPETMVPGRLNPEFLSLDPDLYYSETAEAIRRARDFDRQIRDLATDKAVNLLVGAASLRGRGGDFKNGLINQNAAFLYRPQTGQDPQTYAKRVLVIFGEYIPLTGIHPLLTKALIALTPFGFDYSSTPGDKWTRWLIPWSGGQVTLACPICFEDTMPGPCREMVEPIQGKKQAQILVSITNDGWFLDAELEQHLQMSRLRAIENRVPFARSVNTGDSGLIDSRGILLAMVESNGQRRHVAGVAVAAVPLDKRISLFSYVGNLLGQLCLALTAAGLAVTWIANRKRP